MRVYLLILMTVIFCLSGHFQQSFAETCSENMMQAMKAEGLSDAQIQNICHRLALQAKPANEVIKRLIARKFFPQGNLTEVRIMEIGDYNSQERYWPVKVALLYRRLDYDFQEQRYVIGKDKEYSAVRVYHFFQDDFGSWQAAEVER
ncbi:MAG: hypothetical protein JRJ12_06865 [Deltaproteobacteria bacterium]|nr:hypothetical protein [Deltaproteobacteria bacterium]MBW2071116.1 hypothetical protein [Deltaproteobacteria bacterium]